MPKIRLQGTAMAATSRVSLMAAIASGFLNTSRYLSRPKRNASTNTAASGSRRNSAIRRTVTPIANTRKPSGSVTGERKADAASGRAGCRAASAIAEPPLAPDLDEIDRKQDDEGRDQHDGSDRRGGRVVELFQPEDDQQRQDLGLARQVAGDEDDRAVLAHRAGEGEREAGEDRRKQRRQHYAGNRLRPR